MTESASIQRLFSGAEQTYSSLPKRFYARIAGNDLQSPRVIRFNRPLAEVLGLGDIDPDQQAVADLLSGKRTLTEDGSLAQAYAGHQFGQFVPQLGDGRAVLIAEIMGIDGKRRDLQLKGSGRTPFSRGGDGRAALGPVIREYVVSEAMHALGVPTTRSLAITLTGETVLREKSLPGAVLARVASSHIRVGTFQYFAARGDLEAIRLLADHVIDRHYPQHKDSKTPYLSLLQAVIEQQASLISKWMLLGFIHGVMNTDNMTLSGETIDYGPCAFMDHYDHNKVYSSIDHMGRYAFSNQASIGQWNLTRFAETLVPLIDEDESRAVSTATEAINTYSDHFMRCWKSGMAEKLGLLSEAPGDDQMFRELFGLMHQNRTDFTLTFRFLARAPVSETARRELATMFNDSKDFERWFDKWQERTRSSNRTPQSVSKSMLAVNPAVIPRNHLVERAIRAGEDHADFEELDRLMAAMKNPFVDGEEKSGFDQPPKPEEEISQTFCGT